MLKRNPNILQCPIHGLHYDQTKQDGCALCLRAQERIDQAKKKRKPSSGLLNIVLVALFLGVVSWALLYFLLPPPVYEEIDDKPARLKYEPPKGWKVENRTGRDIALERLGLRTKDTKWSVVDRFSYVSNVRIMDYFIEYIQILKGPGAFFVDERAYHGIREKLKEFKPTTAFEVEVLSTELVPVGDTRAVLCDVRYTSRNENYMAKVYYIPAGKSHYWVMLAAQPHEWSRFELVFKEFVESIRGGRQGEGEVKKLPAFLLSPHRAILAGLAVFLISLYLITLIKFRVKRKKPKPRS